MNTPKMRDISALPFVDGFYLEIDWASVEPSRDNFDWAFLDRQIEAVATTGRKAMVAVRAGGLATRTPEWIFNSGVAYLSTRDYRPVPKCGQSLKVPLPWDENYLSFFSKMITAMGARYASNPILAAIKFEGIYITQRRQAFQRKHQTGQLSARNNS